MRQVRRLCFEDKLFSQIIWRNGENVVPLHPFSGMRGFAKAPHFFIKQR